MIRTVGTDVVMLAVSVAQNLQPDNELWIAFGTGKGFRYLAAHEVAAGLGPDKAQALLMFHFLTECDAVSSFCKLWEDDCMGSLECVARVDQSTVEVVICTE